MIDSQITNNLCSSHRKKQSPRVRLFSGASPLATLFICLSSYKILSVFCPLACRVAKRWIFFSKSTFPHWPKVIRIPFNSLSSQQMSHNYLSIKLNIPTARKEKHRRWRWKHWLRPIVSYINWQPARQLNNAFCYDMVEISALLTTSSANGLVLKVELWTPARQNWFDFSKTSN